MFSQIRKDGNNNESNEGGKNLHIGCGSWLCPCTAACSPPSMSSIVFCLLLSCSRWLSPSLLCRLAIFYLVVPLILFHLSPRLCLSTAACSPPSMPPIVFCLLIFSSRLFPPSLQCRLGIFYLVVPLILFHLSPRLCPSTAGCSPPSMSSIVFCLLLSCSRWFPPYLLCRLAIFYLAVPLISSLSLVATVCSV